MPNCVWAAFGFLTKPKLRNKEVKKQPGKNVCISRELSILFPRRISPVGQRSPVAGFYGHPSTKATIARTSTAMNTCRLLTVLAQTGDLLYREWNFFVVVPLRRVHLTITRCLSNENILWNFTASIFTNTKKTFKHRINVKNDQRNAHFYVP